jgi:hypothetical protein
VAREVTVDPNTGKASGVHFIDAQTMKDYNVRAKVVVVAASTYYDKVDLYLGITGVKENLPCGQASATSSNQEPSGKHIQCTRVILSPPAMKELSRAVELVSRILATSSWSSGGKLTHFFARCFAEGSHGSSVLDAALWSRAICGHSNSMAVPNRSNFLSLRDLLQSL